MASTSHGNIGKKAPLPSTRDQSPPDSAYIGKTVTIEVGTGANKQTFHAHRDLLSFCSGYFEAALHKGSAKAESGVLKLETEEPAVVEGFVKWLYTRKHRSYKIAQGIGRSYFDSIVKLWIYADRRDIPLLMNEMIDCLQQSVVTVWTVPSSSLAEVYDNTMAGSVLRRMMVHLFKSVGEAALGEYMMKNPDTHDEYPKQFLFDLVASLFKSRSEANLSKEDYGKVDMCPLFHIQEDGVKCTRKGTKRSSDEMEK